MVRSLVLQTEGLRRPGKKGLRRGGGRVVARDWGRKGEGMGRGVGEGGMVVCEVVTWLLGLGLVGLELAVG